MNEHVWIVHLSEVGFAHAIKTNLVFRRFPDHDTAYALTSCLCGGLLPRAVELASWPSPRADHDDPNALYSYGPMLVKNSRGEVFARIEIRKEVVH